MSKTNSYLALLTNAVLELAEGMPNVHSDALAVLATKFPAVNKAAYKKLLEAPAKKAIKKEKQEEKKVKKTDKKLDKHEKKAFKKDMKEVKKTIKKADKKLAKKEKPVKKANKVMKKTAKKTK
jgi:septal ring factor EnvC (AmiA/AmiB activator)